MIDARYIKYGAVSGLLLLCTIILSTIENNQNSVFAQVTPAPEKIGGDEPSPNSSPHTHDDGSTGSSGSYDDNDGQGITEEPDETTTAEEQDTATEAEQTNTLVEEIMNNVTKALSSSVMTSPGL